MPKHGNFLSGMRHGDSAGPGAHGHLAPVRLFAVKVLRMKRFDEKPGYGGLGGDPAPSAQAGSSQLATGISVGGAGEQPQGSGQGGDPIIRSAPRAGGGQAPTGGAGGDP